MNPGPDAGRGTEPAADAPIDAREVASAGRSCLVILILAAAVVLVLCVGIALRWATMG
jgi:hypothetical protein